MPMGPLWRTRRPLEMTRLAVGLSPIANRCFPFEYSPFTGSLDTRAPGADGATEFLFALWQSKFVDLFRR
jgi:hypothetical protein